MEPGTQESSFRGNVIKSGEVAGLRLVESVYAAKTKVLKHAHDHAFFCIALTGLCSEDLGGKVRQYQASEVEFLPADHPHTLDFPFADTRAFSINIDTSWIERAHEFSLRLDNSVHARGGLLNGLMIRIYDEFRNPDIASPLAIQGLTMEMFAAVSRHDEKRSDRQPQLWLARAVELLHESFTEHLTLTEIASAVGVHPVYLAREFRRFHGCTIGEYVRRLRIELAAGQLCSSDQSLAAIAAAAGFADQSHFCRTFKRVMGTTPSQYRARLCFGTKDHS